MKIDRGGRQHGRTTRAAPRSTWPRWRAPGTACVLLYLAWSATALAASVPLAAHVEARVVGWWLRRCVPGALAAVAAGAFVAALGQAAVPGSPALDVIGFAGVLTAAGALVLLARSRER